VEAAALVEDWCEGALGMSCLREQGFEQARKDGTRGRLRIGCGDHRNRETALAWLWKFVLCRAADHAEVRRGGRRCACSAGSGRLTRSA
jgi:hypothetical protein